MQAKAKGNNAPIVVLLDSPKRPVNPSTGPSSTDHRRSRVETDTIMMDDARPLAARVPVSVKDNIVNLVTPEKPTIKGSFKIQDNQETKQPMPPDVAPMAHPDENMENLPLFSEERFESFSRDFTSWLTVCSCLD